MTLPSLRRKRPLRIFLAAGVLATLPGCWSYAQAPAAAASLVSNAPALPSGLVPVSQVVVEGSELALDSNGGLFRLEDHGKRWKQVHQQWEGKAVELLGIPALTAAPKSGEAPRPDAASTAETYVAVLLKSTAALHWVSVDRGKTWKPSTLDDVRRNDVKWSGY
jgi:hypothetical protein